MRTGRVEKTSDLGEVAPLRSAATLKEGYIEQELTPDERTHRLSLSVSFGPDGAPVSGKRKVELDLPLYGEHFDTMRYGKNGSTGNVGYKGGGHGAGVLAIVADQERGLVALDIEGAKLVKCGDPSMRELRSLKALAQDPKIKAFAKAGGLDVSKLQVEVEGVTISAAYQDKKQHTLALDLRLSDGRVSQQGSFSAHLNGDLARGPAALRLTSFEGGVLNHAGWLYRPSERDIFER